MALSLLRGVCAPDSIVEMLPHFCFRRNLFAQLSSTPSTWCSVRLRWYLVHLDSSNALSFFFLHKGPTAFGTPKDRLPASFAAHLRV